MTQIRSFGADKRDPAREGPARAPRASVMLHATVEHFGGGEPTRHRVRDLSPGGIRIDQVKGLKVGATVLISIGELEAVGATVRWVIDGRAGLAFAERIDPEQARAKTIIAPRVPAKPAIVRARAAPGAGWVADLRSPYGR